MFDIWIGDMNASFLVYLIAGGVLAVQILLCFLTRYLAVRLIPVILCCLAAAVCLVMASLASGWDGLGWIIFAVYTGFLLLMCALGWSIWWGWTLLRRFRRKKKTNT